MRGLSKLQSEALDQEHECIEEPARQRDVVVERQQPVVVPQLVSRKQRVEVLELA